MVSFVNENISCPFGLVGAADWLADSFDRARRGRARATAILRPGGPADKDPCVSHAAPEV